MGITTNIDPIEFAPVGSVLEVIDTIERHRYRLDIHRPIEIEGREENPFLYPVDRAIVVSAGEISLPSVVSVYVRSPDGAQIDKILTNNTSRTFEPARYILEICAPVKIYLEVDAGMEITAHNDRMEFTFTETARIVIGARSGHRHPQATITITEDPEDIMASISTFGSALKSLTPERSFPTLRGHPPALQFGSTLEIPPGLEPPETGVTIEIRPTLEEIFSTATLAYYLGARLVPGETPQIRTEEGFEFSLDPIDTAEDVERISKQIFLLDCITRTQGLYDVEMYERETLNSRIEIDFAELYQAPLAIQLERYLEIPFNVLHDLIPIWGLVADVQPTAESTLALPYLVDDLAILRCRISPDAGEQNLPPSSSAVPTRSSTSDSPDQLEVTSRQEWSRAAEHVWVGDGIMPGASKAIPAGYQHRFDRAPSSGSISVTVVCNDDEMNLEQNALHNVFHNEGDLDLALYHDVTTADLRDILESSPDLFHYIGHIEQEGFTCSDGLFDAGSLDSTGVGAFFLNACRSYIQGKHLVEAGAIGGIVTLSEVVNSGAITIGATVGRLLDLGFPLYAAIDIAQGESIMGDRYLVIGDGRMALSQPDAVPVLYEIESGKDHHDLTIHSYPTSIIDMGSLVHPFLANEIYSHIVSQSRPAYETDTQTLLEYLALQTTPVRINGEHRWSDDLTEATLLTD